MLVGTAPEQNSRQLRQLTPTCVWHNTFTYFTYAELRSSSLET